MKRLLSLIACAALLLAAISAPNVMAAPEAKTDLESATTKTSGSAAAPELTKIILLHTNDTHGRAAESGSSMGFAKIAALAKRILEENPNTLLLDAGDTFHGTTFATLQKGRSIVEVMNEVGYDAMAAGNHDFNYGYERLVELNHMAHFPILSANVHYENGTRLLEPYVIKETAGIKIGLFGLTTPETTYKTHPNNVQGLIFTDPAEEAKKIVAELRDQVDVIIAVTHLGIDASSTDTSIKIAREVEGIDVIVDGHSHSTLVEGLQGEHDTLIVSAGEYTQNLGVVELLFDEEKKLISKRARLITHEEAEHIPPDVSVLQVIEQVEQEQEAVLSEVIGASSVRLEGEREFVRTGETNLGNLIVDAMLDITGAEVAMMNGGGIRASIEAGEITKGDVITVLPFGNYIVIKEVKGADLKAALENGASAYPDPKGAFPHVGGMSYKIDPESPPGNRVYDIFAAGEPLDLNRTYSLATNDFMAAGGDEYTMFADDPITGEYPALDEALIVYIQKNGVIDAAVEGRIIAVTKNEEAEAPADKAYAGEEPFEKTPPPSASLEDAPPSVTIYVVKKGDTLWAIGRRFGIPWQQLAETNRLANPRLIFPGQTLEIR